MEDINQQSSKKRHISYNWSLENWVWFECRCLTRETRFSWRPGSNTSKGKEKKKKNRLWVIYALTFSGAVEHANSGETTPSTQLNWLFDSQLPASIIPHKKKGRQISAQASPEPAYDSLISQKTESHTPEKDKRWTADIVLLTYGQTGNEEETGGGAIGRATTHR